MGIRPMERREAREVARLRVRMLEELGEMGGDDPRTLVQVTEAYLNRRLGSGGHFTSVAEEQGRLVGIASLEIFERLPYPGNLSGREGYLLNVYVESDFRRRGLAGALVRDLVGVARREGVGRLWPHASAGGRGVYEAAGFEARMLEEMELLLAGENGPSEHARRIGELLRRESESSTRSATPRKAST